MTRLRSKVDALDCSVIGAFESTQEHRATGHASPISYLEGQAYASGKAVARRRRAPSRRWPCPGSMTPWWQG